MKKSHGLQFAGVSRFSSVGNLATVWSDSYHLTAKYPALWFGTHLRFIVVDGGTAWMARESVTLETDSLDGSSAVARWWDLAQQLRQDLASIILMSEADLQVPTCFLYFTNSICCHAFPIMPW